MTQAAQVERRLSGVNQRPVQYSDNTVAQIKAKIADAKRTVAFAPGELARIADDFGMPVRTVRAIAYGRTRTDVEPATA